MSKLSVICFLFLVIYTSKPVFGNFLRVSGRDFYLGDTKVFLSGANIAWNRYGYDFGNGNYAESRHLLEQWVREISLAGGNSIRIWVHVEGESTPAFDSNGFVIGPDTLGTFINDLDQFVEYSRSHNVFVIPVLWNGALMRVDNYVNLVWDEAKLQSYIDNALIPIVRGLKNNTGLGAWEIINEFEGSIRIEGNSNPCLDTSKMGDYGAGWTGASIPIENFLRFINWQSAAIKMEDPKALVTSGSWSEHSQSDVYSDTYDYYKDFCLLGTGGRNGGTIDFYQMHTYSWEGKWNTNAPFKVQGDSYGLSKPLIIGEFSSDCSEGEHIKALFDYAYNKNYSGVWSWQYNAGGHCSDTQETQRDGMLHIQKYTGNGIIPINLE